MLNKIKLFITGGDVEVIPVGCLVGPFCSKGGIGHDAIIEAGSFGLIDGISQIDVGLDSVKI